MTIKKKKKEKYWYFSSIRSTRSYSFHFYFISILVLFGPLSSIQSILSTLILFGALSSYSVQIALLWSCLVLFNPLQFYLVHLGSFQSTSVLFCAFSHIRFNSVLYGPISIIWSTLSTLVSLSPFWSYLVHFSHSILLSPFGLIQSTLVHFDLFWSIQCIQSIFVHLKKGKR